MARWIQAGGAQSYDAELYNTIIAYAHVCSNVYMQDHEICVGGPIGRACEDDRRFFCPQEIILSLRCRLEP